MEPEKEVAYSLLTLVGSRNAPSETLETAEYYETMENEYSIPTIEATQQAEENTITMGGELGDSTMLPEPTLEYDSTTIDEESSENAEETGTEDQEINFVVADVEDELFLPGWGSTKNSEKVSEDKNTISFNPNKYLNAMEASASAPLGRDGSGSTKEPPGNKIEVTSSDEEGASTDVQTEEPDHGEMETDPKVWERRERTTDPEVAREMLSELGNLR